MMNARHATNRKKKQELFGSHLQLLAHGCSTETTKLNAKTRDNAVSRIAAARL
jgi:hypothetical protein